MCSIIERCFALWASLLWYGRRPWHWLFGHGKCQEFLDAERHGCKAPFTIPSHNCCACGLASRDRGGADPWVVD